MSKILVIGDTCKDIHVYGKSSRLAPDAPVPVFVPHHEKQNLGMAGNVYQNIVSLGIPAILKTNNIIVEKKRFVDLETNHMFLRVDSGEEKIQRISDLTKEFISDFDLIAISDYNKGFLTEEDIKFICDNHDNVFMDTKKILGDYCQNCSFIKINKNEFESSKKYLQSCDWKDSKLIVTLGEKGCIYNNKVYPVEKVEIKDLCGAGDTFMSALCVSYLQNGDIERAIDFANECATKVVQMKGVNTINEV
tara:strand:- start:5743 stop:6489 length:747 start_codon:yes stop_codon:yes gene_type:complete